MRLKGEPRWRKKNSSAPYIADVERIRHENVSFRLLGCVRHTGWMTYDTIQGLGCLWRVRTQSVVGSFPAQFFKLTIPQPRRKEGSPFEHDRF